MTATTYHTRDDWSGDQHRHNPDVHYRLYLSPRTNQPSVICVQDFDYLDYDARRVLSPDAWPDEAHAQAALASLWPLFTIIDAAFSPALDPDLRVRLVAAATRGVASI